MNLDSRQIIVAVRRRSKDAGPEDVPTWRPYTTAYDAPWARLSAERCRIRYPGCLVRIVSARGWLDLLKENPA